MKPPDEIEKYCVDTCKKVNGEILSDQISTIYSEIVIDGFYLIAIYTITNGEKEISWNYRRGLELNKKYDEELINKYYKIIFEEFINLKNKNNYNPEKLLNIGRKLIKIR